MEKKKTFRWDGGTVKAVELFIDLILIVVGFNLAWYLRDYLFDNGDLFRTIREIFGWVKDVIVPEGNVFNGFYAMVNVVGNSILYMLIFILMYRTFECSVQKKSYLNLMKSLFLALFFTNLTLLIINLIFKEFGIYIHVDTYIYAFLAQLGLFAVVKYPMFKLIRKKVFLKSMVVGSKAEVDLFINKIVHDKNTRARIEYIVYLDDKNFKREWYNLIDQVERVYITEGVDSDVKNALIAYCIGERKKDVILEPKMYELTIFNTEPSTIDDKLIFNLPSIEVTLEQRILKRLFDIVVSIIGIVCSIPVFLVIGILIKLEDGGPIFYRQERATKGGKTFKIIKIRSMIVNAEAKTGAVLATKGDARITKVGKFIRATRIDELPQFFNVLAGSMSIVGPRPERPDLIVKIKEQFEDFEYRINVKAGITGYAHVFGKYSTSPADRLRMDLLYIRKQNIFFDIKILFYTFLTVITSSASEGLSDNPTVDESLAVRKLVRKKVDENVYKVIAK